MSGPAAERPARRRRLGVLGTLVLDTVVRPGRPPETGLWGGIAYSLAAFDPLLAPGWTIVPLVVLGADLAEPGLRCLRRLSPSADLSRVRSADAPNNRVELRCTASGGRTECLTGSVPGWNAGEVAALFPELDALYVNFVSGAELRLAGARRIRDGFGGPAYADLHSLFLGTESDGSRPPRACPEAPEFAACFDFVQMNEDEFALYQAALDAPAAMEAAAGRPAPAPAREQPSRAEPPARCWAAVGSSQEQPSRAELAARGKVMQGRTRLLAVTRGSKGAEITERPARGARPGASSASHVHVAPPGDAFAPAQANAAAIGCGDVWGAAFFAALLGGASASSAAAQANAAAAANLECRDALDLRASLVRRAAACAESSSSAAALSAPGAYGPPPAMSSASGRRWPRPQGASPAAPSPVPSPPAALARR